MSTSTSDIPKPLLENDGSRVIQTSHIGMFLLFLSFLFCVTAVIGFLWILPEHLRLEEIHRGTWDNLDSRLSRSIFIHILAPGLTVMGFLVALCSFVCKRSPKAKMMTKVLLAGNIVSLIGFETRLHVTLWPDLFL